MMKALTVAFAAMLLLAPAAQAKTRHHRHHTGGSCDGIHRCICGSTLASYFGLPRMYNGHNLWRAVEWKSAFPHTSPHAGAAGYSPHGGPSGHVFLVVAYNGGDTATVRDERGTYERSIRGAMFMTVNG